MGIGFFCGILTMMYEKIGFCFKRREYIQHITDESNEFDGGLLEAGNMTWNTEYT
jgi:hypothetical protein